MNFSGQDLLLAAQVLELAGALRKSAWQQHAAAAELPIESSSPEMSQWRELHPASEFVPEALEKIEAVARQIREIKATSNPERQG